MKSRISYFDPTIFKKDITRFAPAWGLYTIGLLMSMMLMHDGGETYYFHRNLAQFQAIISVINLGYAPADCPAALRRPV